MTAMDDRPANMRSMRTKLLLNFGPLLLVLLLTAVGALWMVQGMAGKVATGEELDQWSRLRWIILSLAVVFLLEINIAVVLILRMAVAIVRPIEKLVDATRELSAGHYDYRVELAQHDEFDELADAYNALAENLQANDQRKMEVLHQVALAMNHELNNAAAIIQVQLQRLNKEAGDNPSLEGRLRQIQTSLLRMTQSVQSLSNARRIVLTDYVPGMKMLDLTKSAAP